MFVCSSKINAGNICGDFFRVWQSTSSLSPSQFMLHIFQHHSFLTQNTHDGNIIIHAFKINSGRKIISNYSYQIHEMQTTAHHLKTILARQEIFHTLYV
mmetsp:Transcript_16396/g.22491  ORF Transcript_16396/g.22491 Transcript_16396/m.22491 type:complete len:99 (-) Transcript_16396:18-314(-)